MTSTFDPRERVFLDMLWEGRVSESNQYWNTHCRSLGARRFNDLLDQEFGTRDLSAIKDVCALIHGLKQELRRIIDAIQHEGDLFDSDLARLDEIASSKINLPSNIHVDVEAGIRRTVDREAQRKHEMAKLLVPHSVEQYRSFNFSAAEDAMREAVQLVGKDEVVALCPDIASIRREVIDKESLIPPEKPHSPQRIAGSVPSVEPARVSGTIYSRIAGLYYAIGDVLPSSILSAGHELDLIREPDNRHDPFAVRIVLDGRKLGYVPSAHSRTVARLIDNHHFMVAVVSKVSASDVEIEIRDR